MLEPHKASQKLPEDVTKHSAELQRQISELIRKMQSGLMQLPESSMLNTLPKGTSVEHAGIQRHGRQPEKFHADAFLPVRRRCQEQPRTPDSKPEPASTAGAADVKQPNDGPERRGGRRYWSEKSVRPMKFEYEFQANPLFRENPNPGTRFPAKNQTSAAVSAGSDALIQQMVGVKGL